MLVPWLVGCRPSGGSESPGDALTLRFDAAAMDGDSCSLYIATGIGRGTGFRGASEFEFTPKVGLDELQLWMQSARSTIGFDGYNHVQRITADLVERNDDKRQVVRKAADDPAARRTIALFRDQPHAFVRLDDHAGIVDYREDFDPALEFPKLEGIGLAWLFGMPHLPVEPVPVGARWEGVRPSPAGSELQGGLPLVYRLVSVRREIATIEMHGKAPQAAVETSRGRVTVGFEVSGRSRVRTTDGAFIDGSVDGLLWLDTAKRSHEFSWRVRSSCRDKS
jgi:hypothetical protein